METNAVLDLMWIVIAGILVFLCKLGLRLLKLGLPDQKTQEIL